MKSLAKPSKSEMTKFEKLGCYLKDKRIEAGLTQKNVSETFGFKTPQFISNIESGKAGPPETLLNKLIDLYKITSVDEVIDIIYVSEQALLQMKMKSLKKSLLKTGTRG